MNDQILFLNQVTGPLFRELVNDVAAALGPCGLLTGSSAEPGRPLHDNVRRLRAPTYDRRGLVRRAISWLAYFVVAVRHAMLGPKSTVLFIVSNPPFLGLAGWLAAVIRGRRYVVLVYDLYPGLLVRLGRISERGLVARLWHRLNRLVWSRAEVVFTVGEHMAENIRREAAGVRRLTLRVVPNWVDVDFIKPMNKAENPVLRGLGWSGRTVVLYSGNLGQSHTLNGLLDAAERLKDRKDIGFLIVGAGARWNALHDDVVFRDLDNVRLLPFQPEALLPQTLAAGDIAVVSMEPGSAGYMVPSKTYYYLAAGSALLALVPRGCEVADLVERSHCGLRVDAHLVDDIVRAIEFLGSNRQRLEAYRRRGLEESRRNYSRANIRTYIETVRPLLLKSP